MLSPAEVAHPAALAWIRPQLHRLPGKVNPAHHLTTAIRCVFFSSYLPDAAMVRALLRDTPLLGSPFALRMGAEPGAPVALGLAMNAINGPWDVYDSLLHGIDFLQ